MTNHTLQRQIFQTGAVLCALSVALGAFGAHLLKDSMEPNMFAAYESAVRYQFFHAMALLFMAAFLRHIHQRIALIVFQIFLVGIVLFSGSLYVLSVSKIVIGDAFRWIGGVTPLGGLAFISGWVLLAAKGYKDNETSDSHHHHSKSSKHAAQHADIKK